MSTIGAIILVFSGATVSFAIGMALLGMPLKQERNLIRSLIFEWLDNRLGKRGRSRISHQIARMFLSVWRPFKLATLQATGIRTQANALLLSRQAYYANLAIAGLAMLTLIMLMVRSDLSNLFVVRHTSDDLPIFFRITATWAGSSGSLLFWYFLLTLFCAIIVYQTRARLFNRLPVLYLSLGLLELLFIMLALFFEDAQPFRALPSPARSGQGLNPLLLHWAMIIHPPILYVGYVSFAIPFAISMAAVITGNLRDDWLVLIRRWSIFAWFFLGFGMLLGGKWAYEELGWGGYWAWDPVENSSLMPTLLATAFLHSLIVQERRGMLRFWNIFLVVMVYHFCLLGTWITRSGILEGPHTFAESSIGWPLITYILLSLAFNLRFLYFRRRALRPRQQMEYVTSKEGSMLLNNFLMLFAVIIIMVGVFSPQLPLDCGFGPDGFSCNKIEWKQSAYNKVLVPIGLITLFLMGASPLLAWRKDAVSVWKKTLRWPLVAGILGGIAFGVFYGQMFTAAIGTDRSPWGPGWVSEAMAITAIGISIFVMAGLFQEYWQGMRSRMIRFNENPLLAFGRLILRNKRRYGGYLAHLAVVFLFIGYTGAAFKKTQRFEFHYYRMEWNPELHGPQDVVHYYSGDKAYLENYEIVARDLFVRPVWNKGADKENPIYFTIAQEGHFHIRTQGGPIEEYTPLRVMPDVVNPEALSISSPYELANKPKSRLENLIKFTTGYVLDGRMITERRFHPQIDGISGMVRRNRQNHAMHQPTSEPDIRSTWHEDIYIQLGTLRDPRTNRTPALNHLYEVYYFNFFKNGEQRQAAYAGIFPQVLIGTLEVWINPLVKFIWLGTGLFFFSGLLLLIPFGEPENRRLKESDRKEPA